MIRARPSRFDRIFEFAPPDEDCRRRYLERMLAGTPWNVPLLTADSGVPSMAFLKELCILCLRHERDGGAVTGQAAKALTTRLRKHKTVGKRRIGMR